MDITAIKNLKDLCSGCSACCNGCKFDAISMELDEEGFYFPRIDKEKCVECGACIKVCQVENAAKTSGNKAECYSAWAKDEKLRMESSSGGMFSLLADYIKDNNGEVYGAVFDKEKKEVVHGRLGDYSIEELRRSK